MLRVSRSSIRDAIRGLELMGLVEPRQGAGTIVCERSGGSPVDPFGSVLKRRQELVTELLDFARCWNRRWRRARLRMLRMKKLRRWKKFCSGKKKSKARETRPSPRTRNSITASRSLPATPLVLKVIDTLMDLLRDTRERSLQVEGRAQKSLAGHRRILAAIKRHDTEAANTAMRRHVEDVEEIVLKQTLEAGRVSRCACDSQWKIPAGEFFKQLSAPDSPAIFSAAICR